MGKLEVKGSMIYSFLNVFQKLSKNLALKIVRKSILTLGQSMPSVHMGVNHSFGFLTNILSILWQCNNLIITTYYLLLCESLILIWHNSASYSI